MTTTRLGLFRAATLLGVVALTGLASTANAAQEPAPTEAAPSSSAAAAPPPAAGPAAPAAAPEAAPMPATAPESPMPMPATADQPPPDITSKRTAWPWVIMGTGVALIATAVVLQVRSVSEDDKSEADQVKLLALPQGDPQRKELQASASAHDDSASNSRTASLVIGTVGFLAVAGSVVWWFFEGGSSSPSTPATARLKPTFTPSLLPGYAGGSLGASF